MRPAAVDALTEVEHPLSDALDEAGVTYDDLSDDLQRTIGKLEIAVEELQAEAKFYFWASLIVVALVLERIWDRFVG